MEFGQKLQALRKARGLTQEELATRLYISRAAISKWESGRGYPSIDLLRAIAAYFSVTVDALLSSDEALDLAQAAGVSQNVRFRSLAIGFLDLLMTMLLFLPTFAQKNGEGRIATSLLSLTTLSPHVKIFYYGVIIAASLLGLLALVCHRQVSEKCLNIQIGISLALGLASLLLFILGLHPYATIFTLALTSGKALVWAGTHRERI